MDIIVNRFEQISDTKFIDVSKLKVRRVDKTPKVFGTYYVHHPINNSIQAEFLAYKKTTAGYILLPYKIVNSYCDASKDETYFYPDLAAASDFPYPFKCPVEAVRL